MNERGFNMIELLVAISIVALISLVAWPNLRNNPNQLEFAATNMASVLRKASSMSLAGQKTNGAFPEGGYGVRIEQCTTTPCTFRIYADNNANQAYDGGAEELPTEVYRLDGQVEITTVTPSPLDIVFRPPVPYVCINQACSGVSYAEVVLTDTRVGATRTLRLNQVSGQITITQ